MYKRVERKRKRREEEEELGLDQDAKEIIGLNDTDSDESDSDSDPGTSDDKDQEEGASGDEDVDGDSLVSVEEAMRDPVYLVSLDPMVYGCVLCKGKLIKNAGTVTAHKDSKVHRRRFERFRLLSVEVDPHSNARDLVKTIQAVSSVQKAESKRALKRQARQATIREKRKHHKELKAKAIAQKALKKLLADGKATPSKTNLRGPLEPQNRQGKSPKKQKLESKTTPSGTGSVTAKRALYTKSSSSSKKSILKSRVKATGKADDPS